MSDKYREDRRQKRVCSGKLDHHEGMSSDDEISAPEMAHLQKKKGDHLTECGTRVEQHFVSIFKQVGTCKNPAIESRNKKKKAVYWGPSWNLATKSQNEIFDYLENEWVTLELQDFQSVLAQNNFIL